jgi:polysaccharide biosynthesis/export protein
MRKNLYLFFFFIPALIIGLSSCVSQKQIAYFQKGPNQHDTIAIAHAYIHKIQAGDILSIYVGSLNPMASSFFNPYNPVQIPAADNSASNGTVSSPALTQASAPGYLVDSSGTINMPLIGIVKLAGLTTSQVRDTISNLLKTRKYLKDPTVNVRVMNFKITVLGKLRTPLFM